MEHANSDDRREDDIQQQVRELQQENEELRETLSEAVGLLDAVKDPTPYVWQRQSGMLVSIRKWLDNFDYSLLPTVEEA